MSQWSTKLELLKRYVARENHAQVPQAHIEDGHRLGKWVAAQRYAWRQGRLDAQRITSLEEVQGWQWGRSQHRPRPEWRVGFDALQAYVDHYGHARVPERWKNGDMALGAWVRWQRREFHAGRLQQDKAQKLEGLPGWRWKPHDDDWQRHLQALMGFVAREGHGAVPQRHKEGGLALGHWVINQRSAHRRNRLEPERKELLEAIQGWQWDPRASRWDEGLRRLQHYAQRHGHARVPRNYVEEGFRLGAWLDTQRRACDAGALEPERYAHLTAVPGWQNNAARLSYSSALSPAMTVAASVDAPRSSTPTSSPPTSSLPQNPSVPRSINSESIVVHGNVSITHTETPCETSSHQVSKDEAPNERPTGIAPLGYIPR